MTFIIKSPRRLIEVALPLDAINAAAAREKSIRHGHPSTVHLWWARRPLAAARAVIFGQMVNDPSWKWEMDHHGEIPPSNLKASWAASRKRIFAILEKLVEWESTTDEEILLKARSEIRKSWREVCELNKSHPQAATLFDPERLPALHDPFAGGGAIPLEAQRLGLEAFAPDLNHHGLTRELAQHRRVQERLPCRPAQLSSLPGQRLRLLLHTFAYNLVNLFRLHLPPALRSAQIETLRTQLFKIGARVRQTARCVRIHLASGWPFQSLFQTVARLGDTS